MTHREPPVQIDPVDCGCTECLTGLYIPLNHATPGTIERAAKGWVGNATGLTRRELIDYWIERVTRDRLVSRIAFIWGVPDGA